MGRQKKFERERVLSDAVQLFWRQGYKDTTLQDLEKATGVNKSGLYSEFADKDDLFTSGLKNYIEQSGILEILGRSPLGWQNLEDLLLSSGRCEKQKGCFVVNCVREFSILPRSAKAAIEAHLKKVREKVVENLKAASAKPNPEMATDLLLSFNSGLGLRHNLGPVKDADEQVSHFLRLLGRKS